jgi:hypothetical protein
VVPVLSPVMVYGEPLEKVVVTVDPDDGTTVTVLEVVVLSLVKEIVMVVVVASVTEIPVGALGTDDKTETIETIVDSSPLSNAAMSILS